jgi:hypothetical protein
LRFSNRAASNAELVERLRVFAQGRMSFRGVARLEGTQPVLGQLPVEWRATGVTPGDLGLEDDEWYMDVLEESWTQALTIEQALERWPIGPWVGLCIDYDLPPGRDDFPSIYGACWWRIWLGADHTWHHTASIEFPTSSVGADERWAGWLGVFIADAERHFEARCTLE